MKISVVTPVLNGKRFIRKTIESVIFQKGSFNLEYIIKDGGSDDGTLELLKDYADHPSVTIVSKRDQSLYDAINQGFEKATGDIGCWINADDYYENGALQKVVDSFAKHPDMLWLYGRCSIVNSDSKEFRGFVTHYKNIIGWFYSYKVLLCENYVNQPATFWKMDLWREVGGLDCKYQFAADYHLWLKFAQCSKALALHEKLAYFRRHGDSISNNLYELQFEEELEVAKQFCNSFIFAMHRFNCWKTITTYKIINRMNDYY